MKNYALNKAVTEANKYNYIDMVDSLIKSPVRYFDENPSGRILNRFTSDAGHMDLAMLYLVSDSVEGTFYLLNLLSFIIIMNFWLIIPSALMLFIMIKWTIYNKSVLMEAKRLDMTNKSPIYSFYTQTL